MFGRPRCGMLPHCTIMSVLEYILTHCNLQYRNLLFLQVSKLINIQLRRERLRQHQLTSHPQPAGVPFQGYYLCQKRCQSLSILRTSPTPATSNIFGLTSHPTTAVEMPQELQDEA